MPPSKIDKLASKNVKAKAESRSNRAGLKLPVARVHRRMQHGQYAPRIGIQAAIYLTAILEYLATEILELAAQTAEANNRSRISPRHLMLAVRTDEELNEMLADVIITQGGVMPHISRELLPKKSAPKSQSQDISSQEY